MEYGIPEAEGLRCPYHGWLYDASGQCTETPLEPSESTFKERVKIAGYPVQEMGGLVFAYLGPQPAPLLPPGTCSCGRTPSARSAGASFPATGSNARKMPRTRCIACTCTATSSNISSSVLALSRSVLLTRQPTAPSPASNQRRDTTASKATPIATACARA